MTLERYLNQVVRLRIGRAGGHERPHKPALLLAVVSLIESGRLPENQLTYGPELFEVYRKYFEVVQSEGDAINMLDPFWRLKSDGLLEPIPQSGFENIVEGQGTPPSVGQLHKAIKYSKLPDELFALLQDPAAREELRQAIVSRYFAAKASTLDDLARQERSIGEYERRLEEDKEQPPEPEEPVRAQAFRRVILRAYDYRCAACGLRVVLDDLVLVEAAHLVPWAVSRDDNPRNGIALCKNHHWAMDRSLIAPTPRMIWAVSKCLDERIEGQRDLIGLRDQTVIPPRDERFRPTSDALSWRQKYLR
ncbi:MAG: HNH endonuclease [Phycisphaeraceae bacterium]